MDISPIKYKLFVLAFVFFITLCPLFSSEIDDAKILFEKAIELDASGDINGAIKAWEDALLLFKKYPNELNEQARCFRNIGIALNKLGKYEESIKHLNEALLLLKNVPKGDINKSFCLLIKGDSLWRCGKLEESLLDLNSALLFFKEQDNMESFQADCYKHIGFVLKDLGKYKEAVLNFDNALKLYNKINDTTIEQAVCWNNKADCEKKSASFDEAIFSYNKARLLFSRVGGGKNDEAQCFMEMGNIYSETENPNKALENFESALDIYSKDNSKTSEQANCNFVIAGFMNELGFPEEALLRYSNAMELLKKIPGSSGDQGLCMKNMGDIFLKLERLDDALKAFNKADEILEGISGLYLEKAQCNHIKGKILCDLGRVEESIKAFQKSIEFYRNIPDTEFQQAEICTIIGGALINTVWMGLGERYYSYAKKIINERLKTGKCSIKEEADLYYTLGEFFYDIKNYNESIKNYELAVSLYNKTEWQKDSAAICFNSLGHCYIQKGKYADAFKNFKKAYDLYDKIPGRESMKADCSVGCATSLAEDGRVSEAVPFYGRAFELYENIRGEFKVKENMASWFDQKSLLYYQSIVAFFEYYRDLDIKDSIFEKYGQNSAEIAFYLSEACHARMLSDILTAKRFYVKDDQTSELLKEKEYYRKKIDKLYEDSLKPNNSKNKVEILNEIKELQVKEGFVEGEINKTSFGEFSSRENIMGMNDVQKQLDPDTALIEYFVQSDDRLIIFYVTKNSFNHYRVDEKLDHPEIPHSIKKYTEEKYSYPFLSGLVDSYRYPMVNYSKARSDANWKWKEHQRAGFILYKMLFPEELRNALKSDNIKHLAIVPDGILNYLPFSTLVTDDKYSWDYDLSYLVYDYSISYLPSASILGILRQEKQKRDTAGLPKYDFLAFADPVYDLNDARITKSGENKLENRGGSLIRLPETKIEALNIASLFETEKTKVFLDFDVNEGNLISSIIKDYRYILFATHALIDDTNPSLSSIALSIPRPESIEKKDISPYLRMDNIFGLELNADLVVLSACETALGRVKYGEGMIGFPLSFFYAGTPSLLASMWKVDSFATAKFDEAFFRELVSGKDKAEAVQRAQISILKTKSFTYSYSHPFFWSSFELIGDWN